MMFESVEKLIRQYSGLADAGSAQSPAAIAEAERALGTRFPASFREYLLRWGTLSLGPAEYFGLGSEINDVVSKTKRLRATHSLPDQFVVLSDHDGDEYVCLDTSSMVDEECAVVIWEPARKSIDRRRALTFEDFLTTDIQAFVDED